MAESKAFKAWARLMVSELTTGKTLEQRVEEDMEPNNLKVEVRGVDGKWQVVID